MTRPTADVAERLTDAELAAIRAAIETRYDADVAALQRLVDIDCGTYTKAGVDEVGRWVEGRLVGLGATIERVPDMTYGDAVIGRLGDGAGPTIVLLAHLDTVFEAGTAAERPFAIADGRATGPGVADMKSGLIAGLSALSVLGEVLGPEGWPHGTIVFIADTDEEIGSPTGTPVIERFARGADAALVLEAARPDGSLVTARKGLGSVVLAFRGRAAHAGVEPEKGRSAVLAAAKTTVALHELAERWDGVTINVGVASGGTRPNIVAEEAELRIDIRATTRAHLDEAIASIEAMAATPLDDVAISVTGLHRWPPMERTAASEALFERAATLGERIGLRLRAASTGGASDGNTTAALGVPTLDGLGPVGGAAHAAGEYLELDSIVPRTTLLAALIASLDPGDDLAT